MATRTKLLRPTEDGAQTEWLIYGGETYHYQSVDNVVLNGDAIPSGTYVSVGTTDKQDEFRFHPSGSSREAGTSTLGTSSIVTLTNIIVYTAGYNFIVAGDDIALSVSVDGGSSWTATQNINHSSVAPDWLSTTFSTGVSGTANDDNLDIVVRLDSGADQTGVSDIYVLYIVVNGTDTGVMSKILRPVAQGVNTDWTGTYEDIDDVVTRPDAGGTATKIYTNANVNESVLLQGDTFGIYKMQTIESDIYAVNDDDTGDTLEVDVSFKYDGSFVGHSTESIDYPVAWENTSRGTNERERSQFGGNLEMDFDNVGDTGDDESWIHVAYAKIFYRPQQPG